MNRMRGAILSCAGLLAAAAAVENALGQCLYDIDYVVTPDFGCPEYLVQYSVLNALNESGQGAGTTIVCTFSSRAFSWSSQTGYRLLPGFPTGASSAVDDMTDGGLIAGTMCVAASDLSCEAFIHDGQQVTSLGAPPGASYSYAEAINEQGWVVGRWGNPAGIPPRAFLWHDGVMTDLSPDLGTYLSDAWDINDLGQVTGYMGTNHNDGHAFIWDDGAVTDLPVVPGGFTSCGEAINNHGDIAGWGKVINPTTGAVEGRGLVYIDGQMIVLEPLPGYPSCKAQHINDARQVTGWSYGSPTTDREFLWQNGVQTDFNELIPESVGVVITGGGVINESGQITGFAWVPSLQESGALVLTPQEQPLADLDYDCRVGVLDLLAMLTSWGACRVEADCAADVNGDGNVDRQDLTILLMNWS